MNGQLQIRRTAVIVAFVATIMMSLAANILPLGIGTTGAIADALPIFFLPAGYVFSIWLLIYAGLLIYVFYQALPPQADNARVRSLDGLFILSSLFHIGWIFAWHALTIDLALIMMLGLLLVLVRIYEELYRAREGAPPEEWVALDLTFSVYLGWASVMTFVNAAAAFVGRGWRAGFFPAAFWTVLVMLAVAALAVAMLYRRRDFAFGFVVVWAILGIAVRFWDVLFLANLSLIIGFALLLAILYRYIEITPPEEMLKLPPLPRLKP